MRSLPKNNSHFAESSEASKANQEIINTKSASNFVRFEYNKLGVQEQSTDNNLKEYIATKVAALGADSTPHPARQFRYIIGKPAAGYYSKMNNSADSLQNYINTLITRCHNNNTENNSNKFLPLNDRLATLEQQLTSYQQSLNSEKNRNKLISQALEVLTIYTDLLQFIDENISLSQPQISQEDLNYIQQLGMLLCNIGTHKFIRHDSLFGGKSQEFVKFNQQALKQFYQQTQIVIKPFEVQQKVQQEQIEKYQQQIEQTIEEIHDDANNSFALTIQKNQQAQQNLLELEQMLNSLSLNELLATILRELNKTDKPTQHELAPASTALAPLKDALLEFDQLQYQLKMYEIKADQNLQQQLTQFSESNLKLRQLAEEQIKNNPDSQLGILLTKLCDQLQNYSYFDLYKQFLARKLKPQIISSEQTQLISSDDFLEYFLQFEIANQLELLKNQESYLAISQQHKYIQDLAQQLSLAALKEQAQAFLEQLSSLKQQSNQLSQLITQLIKQPDEINNIQKINQAYNNLCQTIIEFNLNLQKANLINLLTPQTLAIMANLENQSTYFATTIHHIYNNTLLALYLTAGKHYQEQLNYLLKATPDKLMPSRLKGINPEAMNNLLDNLDQIELNTTSEVSIAAEKAIFQTQLAIKYIYQSDPKLNNGLEKVYNCLNYALHLQSVLSGISKTNDDFLNLTYLSSTYEHNCLKFMHLYAVLNVSYRSLSRYVQTSQQQLQNLFADLQQYIANDKIYASYTQQLQMIYQSIMHKFNELTQKLVTFNLNLGTVSTKLAEGELSQGLQLLKTNSKILTNILQTLIDLNYQIKVFSDETINSGGIEFINHQTHCQNHTLSAYLNDILKRQILQQATIASMVIDISLKPHKLNELQDQMRAQIETLTIANPENNAELGAKKAFETHLFLLLAQVITEMDKNTLSLENYLPLLYAASKNGYQNIPINEYQLKDKLKAKFKIDTNVKNTYEQIERNARSISFGDYSEIINFQQTLEKSLQEQNFAKEMLDTLAKGSTFNPCLNYLSQVTIINLFVRQGLAPQVVQTLLTLAQNFELAYLLHFKLIDKDGSIKDDTNRYLFGLIRDDKELHPRRLDSYWLLSLKIIYQLFLLLNAIVENQSPADTLIKNLTSFAKQLIEPTKQRTLLMAFQQALECLKNLNDVAQLKQPPIQTKLRALKKSQQSEIINSINQLCVPQLDFALLYQQISGIFKDEGTTGKSMLIFKMHIEKIICYTSLTSLQAKINQLLLKEKLAR